MQVIVRNNNVERAAKILKKKMQKESIFKLMRIKTYFEKPSEKKARKKKEYIRRMNKIRKANEF